MQKYLIKNALDLKTISKTMPYQFIDCTYYLPNEQKKAFEAMPKINDTDIFFGVDSVADMQSSFSHTFPPSAVFGDYCQKNNIHKNKNYIFYDHKGIFSSTRVYFTFLAYGFNHIYVLDGGYNALDSIKDALISDNHISADIIMNDLDNPVSLFIDSDYVSKAINNPHYKIIDARPKPRFDGTAPEPRVGLLSGHIPTSLNLPFTELLTVHKTYKSLETIKNIFDTLGIQHDDTLIFSCGSGITACVVAFAAYMIGFKLDSIKIYDASWCEWGNGHFKVEKT